MSYETTTTHRTTGDANRTVGEILRGGGLGATLALIANTVVYTIGKNGAPIQVITGWAPDGADLSYIEVVATSTVTVVAGGLVLWLLHRRGGDALRRWTILAIAVAIVSAIPLWRLDVDTGSRVALTIMHLVTGAAAIAGHQIVRRTR